MAPNQKFQQNTLISTPLPLLNEPSLLAQPKQYLPLTRLTLESKNTEEDSVQQKQEALPWKKKKAKDVSVAKKDLPSTTIEKNDKLVKDNDDEYWNWPTLARDTVMSASRNHREKSASTPKSTNNSSVSRNESFLFSAEYLEAKLVAESQRLQERLQKGATMIRAAPQEQDEGYWDERSEQDVVLSQANQAVSERTGYWDWPNNTTAKMDPMVALILKEEWARHQVSAETLERLEVRATERAGSAKNVQHVNTTTKEDYYWLWESPPVTIYADKVDLNDESY